MLTNFELKRLKPKLDIVKKPENRVHELTDSNVSPRKYAPKCACAPEFAHICATKQSGTKPLSTNIGTILKNMPTNFELKRLKPKLDIVKKPENRVHELTDSNVSLFFGIVPMFVLKDFVQDCSVAQICAKICVRAVIRA